MLVFEQDVERGERSVTARDILLQVELVRIAQFVARVHLLFENSQIIPNHDDLVPLTAVHRQEHEVLVIGRRYIPSSPRRVVDRTGTNASTRLH